MTVHRLPAAARVLVAGNAVSAFVASPAISAGLIAAGLAAAWIGLLCAACLVTALLGFRLSRQLTPAQDRVSAPAAPQPAPV
ncbi:MAG: hypothetical protein ACM32E_17780 [Gemmatimonadota bacterium]